MINKLHQMWLDFRSTKKREPTLLILHPELFYKFEIWLKNEMNGMRTWRGLRVISSGDISKEEILMT